MIQLEIANINLLERIKKGQVNFMKKKITAILMVILIGVMAAGCGHQRARIFLLWTLTCL